MILYVNACVRKDSRTKRLSDRLIEKLNGTVEEVSLDKENSTNFNNAIQRFFPIQRKRPNGESGGPTTMLIGCRFLEKERGEPEEENAAFS